MINYRDAKILFTAIVKLNGKNIINMKDGDFVRRNDVFEILNSLFEDGIEIKQKEIVDDKLWKSISYSLYFPKKYLNNIEDSGDIK